MRRFLLQRWFLLTLACVLGVSFMWPGMLKPAVDALPRQWIVAGVMFLMALPLDAAMMWSSVRRPQAVLLAIFVSAVLAPLVAWGVSYALPRDLACGLLIAGAMPSTLASAAVWTRRAGGHDAIAMLATLVTNLGCFVVMPFWLTLTVGDLRTGRTLDAASMLYDLLVTAAVPIVAAQLLRLIPAVGVLATRRKVILSTLCQVGILCMVFTGSVRSGLALRGLETASAGSAAGAVAAPAGTAAKAEDRRAARRIRTVDWVTMLAAVMGVHVVLYLAGHALGMAIRLARGDRIAVAFSGSQKTLVVGLSVAQENAAVVGPLAIVPLVAYHVSQLFIDTLFADRLKRNAPSED